MIKIGLKANAQWSFEAMNGNTLGGETDTSRQFSSIMHLSPEQFFDYKELLDKHGFDSIKSLTELTENQKIEYKCDYICHVIKK